MISPLLLVSLCASAAFAQNSTVGKTCTIPSRYASSNGTADDSPAIASAFADCASGGTVLFSEGLSFARDRISDHKSDRNKV
jgi:polygalacturonase